MIYDSTLINNIVRALRKPSPLMKNRYYYYKQSIAHYVSEVRSFHVSESLTDSVRFFSRHQCNVNISLATLAR